MMAATNLSVNAKPWAPGQEPDNQSPNQSQNNNSGNANSNNNNNGSNNMFNAYNNNNNNSGNNNFNNNNNNNNMNKYTSYNSGSSNNNTMRNKSGSNNPYGSSHPHTQQQPPHQQQQQQQQNINYYNNNNNNNNAGNLQSHFNNNNNNNNTMSNNNNTNNNQSVSPTAAKLFVGQLPFECTEERLRHLFSAYGHVEQIHILKDNNNRSRGAAFITFSNVQEADTAIFTLHNRYRMLTNRAIQVSYAKNSLNISPFGTHSAIEVHQSNPTNPMPDVATMINNQQMRNF